MDKSKFCCRIFPVVLTVISLVISIIPIGIFYWLNDKEKYQSRAKAISLLGFLPAIGVLGFIVL